MDIISSTKIASPPAGSRAVVPKAMAAKFTINEQASIKSSDAGYAAKTSVASEISAPPPSNLGFTQSTKTVFKFRSVTDIKGVSQGASSAMTGLRINSAQSHRLYQVAVGYVYQFLSRLAE